MSKVKVLKIKIGRYKDFCKFIIVLLVKLGYMV